MSSTYSESANSANAAYSEDDPAVKKAKCIRNVTNMSIVKPTMLMDTKVFNVELLKQMIPTGSPKIVKLFEKIAELDSKDMRIHKKHYKHMIFTDIDKSSFGAKLLASAFVAYGFTPVFTKGLGLKSDETLMETAGKNFGLLISKTFGEKSMSTKFKKAEMSKYNSRPSNTQGELMRFIILDQGFKEGIDLFDVKYVHLFEPLVSRADEKQAIGRGTRFCGQKGLEFHPRFGWPLYIFRYDISLGLASPRFDNVKTLFELYLKNSDIDMRRVVFAAELEKAVIEAAVDKSLTKEIHSFKIDDPPPILTPHNSRSRSQNGGAPKAKKASTKSASLKSASLKSALLKSSVKSVSLRSVAKSVSTKSVSTKAPSSVKTIGKRQTRQSRQSPQNMKMLVKPPVKIMGYEVMQAYIKAHYSAFKYPKAKLENMCLDKPHGTGDKQAFTFTPTQDFVRNYFTPSSAYKGLLLYHSVGTGKTCSAIATATSSFEKEGYTIMWVTRHTLKSDIWKNMFDQICSVTVQERVDNGSLKIPKTGMKSPMGQMDKHWIEPMSYKQFSNMLLKQNKFYNNIVKRNGEVDPLHKTLIVIDEAHKLYAENVSAAEKPDSEILERMIQNSYNVSGDESVRVLLMTATPYTTDGMEMIKLLNLLKPEAKAMPTEFPDFADEYLNNSGFFTTPGLNKFQNAVSGYVSYLNRSQDARNFSHPVIENVYALMSRTPDEKEKPKKHVDNEIKDIVQHIKELRLEIKQEKLNMKDDVKKTKANCAQEQRDKINACKDMAKSVYDSSFELSKSVKADDLEMCKTLEKSKRATCKDNVTTTYKTNVERIKSVKTSATEKCNDLKLICARDKESRLALLNKKVIELDKYILETKNKKENTKQVVKKFQTGNKDMMVAIKSLKPEAKEMREELKEMMEKMKGMRLDLKSADTEKKKIAIKAKIKDFNVEIKSAKDALKDIKSKITNLTSKKKLARIEIGRANIGDVSQETALTKRCL